MKTTVLRDVTPCSPVEVYRSCILPLLDLFFEPEDGGNKFLRNVMKFHRSTRRHIPELNNILKWIHDSVAECNTAICEMH
jgi:hypothetical protein